MNWSDVLADLPIIAVLRGIEPAEATGIAEALFEGGVRCVEVTLNSPSPFDSITAIRSLFDGRMFVGAGTVLTLEEIRDAASAGAELIVSPDAKRPVIEGTKNAGLASLPGVFTPGEAFAALGAGADALKLFPAEATNPAALKAMLAVLPPGVAVLPVGGIEATSMVHWRAAGAAGFGVGGSLYRRGATPDEVRVRARAFAAAWTALS